MNVWNLDNEPVVSQPRVKKACFADEVEVVSTSGWGANAQSHRRKQRGKIEFLVDEHDVSDEEEHEEKNLKGIDFVEISSAKASEIVSADLVESVNVESSGQTYEAKQEQQRLKDKEFGNLTASNHEITVHHLVREFLLMHCHDDVVKILDQERVSCTADAALCNQLINISMQLMPRLDDNETKLLHQRFASTSDTQANPSIALSLLEQFLMCSNEAKIRARAKCGVKPTLNVITSNLGQVSDTISNAAQLSSQVNCDYNRLNHPGSTPHHQPHEAIIGKPGSTPMARAKDLRALGYEDIDEDGNKATSDQLSEHDEVGGDADHLSEYALRKRALRSGPKHVQLGNPGSTPTKEYIFFRETPPSFVTETIEEAVEVFEKLGNDPEFVKQATVVERFIELQSSEVSKYTVGQNVNELGAQSNISGVVSKIYGSRLCGTAGPGTIVIDTCPESLE
ncbi:unnamed protein product [Phytophthora fragariaefolia]|uniref:Unnamed protein product n=1 Tax=Phytophthora fragariaefolia TaxID=1490495 RepID=A0A9W6U3S1_9STRA|nr:unnamed protein product [Phytophthora fragariaefolia]